MDPSERKGWMEIMTAEELDTRMAKIKQAQANAQIVKEMFNEYPLKNGSRLLIPGCGTAQSFDYIIPSDLGDIELILTDINESFLSKTQERLSRFPGTKYNTQIDDIENTQLRGSYDAALIAMVLMHVECEKALESMLSLNLPRLYIIEQEQDLSLPAVTKSRDLTPVWREFAKVANVKLIPRKDLINHMENKGYSMIKTYEKDVPDNKTMVGLVFERK